MKRAERESRIYWRPVRLVCYLLVYAFFLALYLFFRSHMLFMALVVLLLMPVISIGASWKMLPMLTLRLSPVQPEIRRGEEGIWRVSLANAGWWVSLECRLTGTIENTFYGTGEEIRLEMPVSMRQTERVALPFVSDYCGQLRLCFCQLEYLDLLGLVRIRTSCETAGEIAVLPREKSGTTEKKSGYQTGVRDAEESTAKGNDSAEVTDMREYRPGDRLKDIHWKLSAKKEVLMVKERASVAQSEVVLLLDLTSDREQTEEVLGLAYGVAKSFLAEYVPVRMLWWDADSYDFRGSFLAEAEELEQGFHEVMRGKVCQDALELPSLMRRIHPEIRAFVLLHAKEGEAQGEVIFHG